VGALIRTDSAPGSRTASWFFEQFPRFYLTSSTAATTAQFGENRDIFAGALVLDLGSHDGRWSLAALATGARSVIGVEAWPQLVKAATENLGAYGYGADRATFVTGDVHEVLRTQDFEGTSSYASGSYITRCATTSCCTESAGPTPVI
jgi:Methyltransferase domain